MLRMTIRKFVPKMLLILFAGTLASAGVIMFGAASGWLAFSGSGAVAAPATPRYVSTTGDDTANLCTDQNSPCATIQHALDNAVSGDDIWVAGGIYTENLNIPVSVTILGGLNPATWAYEPGFYFTIIDGSNGGFVLYANAVSVTLSTLILQNSVPDVFGDGGGIYADNSTLTARHILVQNNSTDTSGAGMQAYGSDVSLYYSDFRMNKAKGWFGGMIIGLGSTALISQTLIYSNSADSGAGGLGLAGDSALAMYNSSIEYNHTISGEAGGILAMNFVTLTVRDSTITNNWAKWHGGAASLHDNGFAYFENVLMSGNGSTEGPAGAFVLGNFDVEVMNTTIADNNPPPSGHQAIIVWSGGELTMTNSIVWNNGATIDQDPPCAGCVNVTYSVMQGGYTGTGNIDADPMFVGLSDYRLKPGSPAVDSGTFLGAPPKDIDGVLRGFDGDLDGSPGVDMGAYELWWYQVFLPLTSSSAP